MRRGVPGRAHAASFAFLLLFLVGRGLASAATVQVQVLLDVDNNPATGCTVVTSKGTFTGAEQVLTTTVDTTANLVTGVVRQVCSGGSFGAPIAVNSPIAPPWPIGVGAGVNNSALIESYVPLSVLGAGSVIRAGFVTIDQFDQEDAILDAAPIVPAGTNTIPTLSTWGLIALAVLLAGGAILVLRRSGGGLFVVLLVLLLSGGVAFAAFTMTGNPADWAGIPPLATKAASSNPTRADIYAVYAARPGDGNLYFRFDVKLCPQITVAPTTLPDGSTSTAYPATNFTQTGGTLPITWSNSGALPTGMTFDSAGLLSGSPTQVGSFPIVFTATDASGCTGSQAITLTIDACPPITVLPNTLAPGTGNTAYGSVTFTATGGTGAITWSSTGALPAGMTFSAGGVLAGTPTQTGSFPVTFIATDANNCTGSQPITLVINCQGITVTNPGVTTGTANAPFSQTFTETGGVGTTTFTTASTLPTGLSLSTGGVLSGTPTQTGSFPIVVSVTDSNGCTSAGPTYTLVIGCQTITVTPASLPAGTAGAAYSASVSQTGGIGTATFTETGTLPSGMSFSGAGVLSGTPTQVGSFPITVTVTDANGCTGTSDYTLVVNCQTITVTNPATSTGTASTFFSQTFAQAGAIGGATFTTASTLPAGMTLATNGTLSGTPTQTGTFPIVVTVTDGNGCTGTGSTYTLTIGCQTIDVGPASLPQGATGVAYPTTTFTQSGGIGAVTFTQTGALPNGLTFVSGVLSGTPTQSGSFPITVTAADSNGCTGSHDYLVVVVCSGTSVTLSPGSLPSVTVNTAFPSTTFTASGGVGPYTFTEAGALPSGMTFVTDTLSGTPTQTGIFPITISATDTVGGCVGSQDYVVTVTCNGVTVIVSPASLAAGAPATPYAPVTFTASGGTGPYTFTEVGALPAGMSFSVDTLSGTPTVAGTFPVTVTATDSAGCSGARSYTLSIVCQTITVTNPGTTTGTVDTAFSQTFTQTGAVGTSTFTTASTLPSGLTLSSTGVLSGTPAQPGSFPIVVTVTDSNGCTGSGATYTLVISCQTITVTNPGVTTATVDAAFSQTFTQSGVGTHTPATFTLNSGSLPSGLTLSAAGVLSGTPGQSGSFPITVKVTDANGCTGISSTYTLVVGCQAITVTNPGVTTATFNSPFSRSFTQTGVGTHTPATFTTASALPTGVTLSPAGVLSGTPTQTGTFPIVVTVTDANGCTGTGATYNLAVAPVAVADSYAGLVDNTQFVVTGGTTSSPATPFVGTGGAATFRLTNNDLPSGGVSLTTGTFATTAGGSVTIAADGTFIYTPKANPVLPATVSDSFTYTISSNTGGTATATTATGTASLTLAGRVWYVLNNGAAGNGQSQSPFQTLAAAIGASTANDNIFVYRGDGTTANLSTPSVLKTGQTFTGQGAVLIVNGNTLVPAGPFPLIGGSLTLANNVTVNGIDMSTGASDGIVGSASPVTVTARNVTTTSGRAVNVTGGSGSLTFQSLSVNGAANGIVLTNFAGTGLKVTGTAGPCTLAAPTCTGGAILNTTGDGMVLTNTKVDLSFMRVQSSFYNGIDGTNLTGFLLTDSLLNTNTTCGAPCLGGANGSPGGFSPAGILLSNVNSASGNTVTRVEVTASTEDNVRVHNDSGSTGTILFDTCNIHDNSSTSGNDGLFVQTVNSGNLTATVQNSHLQGNRTIALRADAADTSTLSAIFASNVIVAGSPNQGNQGIEVSRSATSTVTFNVHDNLVGTPNGVTPAGLISTGINIFSGGGDATHGMTGDVKNNAVIGMGVTGNQIGIRIFNSGSTATGAGFINANVASNTVRNHDNAYGILVESSGSTGPAGLVRAAVTGNTVSVAAGGNALDAIRLQARNSHTVCASVTGNTTDSGGPGFFGLFVRQGNNTATFNLEGLALGLQSSSATINASLTSQNPAATTVGNAFVTGITGVAAASCGVTP